MTEEPDPDLLARAEAGDAEAQHEVGLTYAARGPEHVETAVAWFRKAADQGLARARHNLGVHAFRSGNAAEAAEHFLAAAKGGWTNSMLALGIMLERDGARDKATIMYRQAAERGHPEGQDALARLAFQDGTPEGYETARHWSEQAAVQGDADSHARLGTIYHEGLGVERDPKQAARHWLAAALSGHPGAQLMIGAAFDVGAGVAVDKLEAAYFLALSAAQGSGPAAAYLHKLLSELPPEQRATAEDRLRGAGVALPVP